MMKIKHFWWLAAAVTAMAFLTSWHTGVSVKADTVSYEAKATFQCSKVRYKADYPTSISTHWEQGSFPSDLGDMSFGRLVLSAPTSGTYTLGVDLISGSYALKVFVNGAENDFTAPGNGWGSTPSTYNFDVSLNAGNNVVIIAFNNWGYVMSVRIPDTLTIVGDDHSGGVYHAAYAEMQEVGLYAATETLHSPTSAVYAGPVNYDSNGEFASKVRFLVDAAATTQSVNLSYYVTAASDGLAELDVSVNGHTPFGIALDESAGATIASFSIPTATLNAAGFVAEAQNTIEITKPSSASGSVMLVSLTLSDSVAEGYATQRFEAEDAVLNGGSVQSADNVWSGGQYVGDMGTKTVLGSADEIAENLANVNSLGFAYTAANAATYRITIAYATSEVGTVYLRANKGAWQTIAYTGSGGWNTVGLMEVSVPMSAGSKTITLTGATTSGSWLNYDYIEVHQISATATAEQATGVYAAFFRDSTAASCAAQDITHLPWANLKSEYLDLSADEKDAFVNSTDATISDARARYQVLIHAYPTLENWLINGSGAQVYSAAEEPNVLAEENPYLLAGTVGIIGLVTLIGWIAYSFRKKQDGQA